jgi:hypothetical protein
MLPLQKLLQATPDSIKRRARAQCFGKSYKPPRRKKTLMSLDNSGGYLQEDETGEYREYRYRVKCTDGWRKTAVRFYGAVNVNTRVWCWCSCPYFKYHCEVALASKGSSSVVQSNGQRPRVTNPKLEPRVCKHVYLLFALAMRKRTPQKGPKEPQKRGLVRRTLDVVRNLWRGD